MVPLALLLAARRQQSTEQTLEHERENAAEQRITELCTRAVDQLGAEKAPVRLAVRAYLIRRSSHRPAVRLAVEAQLGGRHTATQAALKRPYRRRTAGPSARWWSGRAQLGCSEQTVQDRMTTTTTTEESHLDGRRNTMADRPRHVHAH